MAAKGHRRPPPAHGTQARYGGHGCRCQACVQAHSTYMRQYAARRAARDSQASTVRRSPTEAKVQPLAVAAVRAELEGLSAASEQRPALVAIALKLAGTLDDPSFGSSHSSLSRELRAVLDELHAVGARRGKLASVSALARR